MRRKEKLDRGISKPEAEVGTLPLAVEIKAQLQARARDGSIEAFTALAEKCLNEAPNDEHRKAFIKNLIDNPGGNAQPLLHVARAQKFSKIFSFFKFKANYTPQNWELVFKLIDTFGANPDVESRGEKNKYPLLI
jgi:hypothetical protein